MTRGLEDDCLAEDLSELLRRRRCRRRVLVENSIGILSRPQFRGLKPGRHLFLLFSLLSPSLLLSEVGRFPPSSSGGLGVVESPASSWQSGGAAWSEEEAAGVDGVGFGVICPMLIVLLCQKATGVLSRYGRDRGTVAFSSLLMLNVTGQYVMFRSEGGTLVIVTGWRRASRRLLVQKATPVWSRSGCWCFWLWFVPWLADGPPRGFWEVCRACLCLLVSHGYNQLCRYLWWWTPILGSLLREFSGLQACSSRQPTSPSHCLALQWFRSHVGSVGVGPQLGRAAVGCSACGPLTLWRTEVAVPMVRAEGCFYILFDSAGSAGVVFGPTLVVGRGIALFHCLFLLLWLVVCFTSRAVRALADGGLVSAVGVWLAVLLVEVLVLHCGFPLSHVEETRLRFFACGFWRAASEESFLLARGVVLAT
ncbi:hypothetical protein Taro_007849, partial [Colocasia esculenta]|nr:hypothetical protein [Colocasia esculenta]